MQKKLRFINATFFCVTLFIPLNSLTAGSVRSEASVPKLNILNLEAGAMLTYINSRPLRETAD